MRLLSALVLIAAFALPLGAQAATAHHHRHHVHHAAHHAHHVKKHAVVKS
jgi:hypothetical protein